VYSAEEAETKSRPIPRYDFLCNYAKFSMQLCEIRENLRIHRSFRSCEVSFRGVHSNQLDLARLAKVTGTSSSLVFNFWINMLSTLALTAIDLDHLRGIDVVSEFKRQFLMTE